MFRPVPDPRRQTFPLILDRLVRGLLPLSFLVALGPQTIPLALGPPVHGLHLRICREVPDPLVHGLRLRICQAVPGLLVHGPRPQTCQRDLVVLRRKLI